MHARHAAAALTVVVATAVGATTACSAFQNLSTAEKVNNAFNKLNDGHEATIDFQLKATTDQLLALDAAASSSDSKMTRDQAKQISGLGITVSMRSKKPLKDALKASNTSTGKLDPSLDMDLAIHNGAHTSLAEYRSIAGKAYMKLNIAELAKLGGDNKNAAELQQLQAMTDSIPRALEPIRRLLQGNWVSIDPAKFAKLSKQASGDTKPSPMPSLNPDQQQKISDTLSKIIAKDATFSDKGTSDGIDTIEIKANARKLITDIQQQVFPHLKDVPGVGGKLPTSAPTSVPTAPATVTVKLNKDGGTLNTIALDLGQFDTSSKGNHFPLAMTFKDTATNMTAPAGAIEFDPNSIEDLMATSLGG
ncbi:hypothetical protein [Streptomyces carpinensis]|uniref:Lipoprotein n=1 Tax=Streptomyces carpinensis TaxID=66369 RepID=A0ABV1VZY9_9ACTN|nr:hypothetical protein [Streptomyces carpinensis]